MEDSRHRRTLAAHMLLFIQCERVTCVLEVSMVGMGFAFDPERGV